MSEIPEISNARARRRLPVALAALLVLASGCASTHRYELVGGSIELESVADFYVLLNSATEKVDYNYLANPFNYASYARDRIQGSAKLDVPIEILRFLHARGKNAAVGPPHLAPRANAIIISYEELWGWDVRPIIKSLTIHAHPVDQPAREASISFAEMTIFNTQPVASSLVPPMLDRLFASPAPKS